MLCFCYIACDVSITLAEQTSTINKKSNIEVYKELVDKHINGIYKYKKNPVGTYLKENEENFIKLSLFDECFVLNQILILSQKTNNGADLRLIGLDKSSGKMTVSKNITNYKEVKLLQQSITGIFNKELDLLNL